MANEKKNVVIKKLEVEETIVSIICGDLLDESVDAIVIPVAKNGPGGRLGQKVYELAGEEIVQARNACEYNGRIKVGKAIMTEGFGLGRPFVCHTAVRERGKSFEECKADLATCYRSAIMLSKNYTEMHSMAFPVLGTGGANFNFEIGFSIALKTIVSIAVSKKYPVDDYLKRIYLIVDEEAYESNKDVIARVIEEAEHIDVDRDSLYEICKTWYEKECANYLKDPRLYSKDSYPNFACFYLDKCKSESICTHEQLAIHSGCQVGMIDTLLSYDTAAHKLKVTQKKKREQSIAIAISLTMSGERPKSREEVAKCIYACDRSMRENSNADFFSEKLDDKWFEEVYKMYEEKEWPKNGESGLERLNKRLERAGITPIKWNKRS